MNYQILLGKLVSGLIKLTNLGSGSTWPGHIAVNLDSSFNKKLLAKNKIKTIVVAGTNGKTTTSKLIKTILEEDGKKVLQNEAGANLQNGLSSTLVKGANLNGGLNYDFLIFEADENSLPIVLEEFIPDYIILLNLFRDQLDRYGEIDTIARKWKAAIEKLPSTTVLILNADDPSIAFIGKDKKTNTFYFGLDEKGSQKIKHGADTIYCPNCSEKLSFKNIQFSHLGDWNCPNCGFKRPATDISSLPSYPLAGEYNKYNSLASFLLAKKLKINQEAVKKAFKTFEPAFGRQEKIKYKGKNVQIFLSKNPTSFNESLSTVLELGAKNILILFNDRVPDGLDVSWIWDINFEEILGKRKLNIAVSGDRVYDMALRLKYAEIFTHVIEQPETALNEMVRNLEDNETLFILPNYSAMLDIRKVLTGRKIL